MLTKYQEWWKHGLDWLKILIELDPVQFGFIPQNHMDILKSFDLKQVAGLTMASGFKNYIIQKAFSWFCQRPNAFLPLPKRAKQSDIILMYLQKMLSSWLAIYSATKTWPDTSKWRHWKHRHVCRAATCFFDIKHPVVRTRHGLYAQRFIVSTQVFEKNLQLPVLLNPTFACPAKIPWSCTCWSVSHARLRAMADTLHRLAEFCALSISSAYCDASHCQGGGYWLWPAVPKVVWLQIQRLPGFGAREWKGVEAIVLQPVPQYQPRSVIKPGI